MSIFALIKDIFRPAVELVDELHTSTEERLAQKARTLDTYARALEAGMDHEIRQLEARAKIVEAEAKSEHVITATWRPIVMLAFACMAVGDSLGLLPTPLADEMWLLLQLGIGGYVVGRSVEKTGVAVVGALKKKDEV